MDINDENKFNRYLRDSYIEIEKSHRQSKDLTWIEKRLERRIKKYKQQHRILMLFLKLRRFTLNSIRRSRLLNRKMKGATY